MKSLRVIANKYKTDKKAKKHNYILIYENLFSNIRDKELNILEMGVKEGASIRMWLDYFPNSQIIGLDSSECPGIDNDRYEHLKRDQSNLDVFVENPWANILDLHLFDIIIDDCSHITELSIYSFFTLKKYLSDDGLYIIEDCHDIHAKYTKEILGKYGEIVKVGKDAMIIIRGKDV